MTHISSYVKDESKENAMAMAMSYLEGPHMIAGSLIVGSVKMTDSGLDNTQICSC